MHDTDGRLWLTPFHRLEFRSAVELRLFRKEITKGQAARVLTQFVDDLDSVYAVSDLPHDIFSHAYDLAAQHTARLGTRSLDILHVALAQALEAAEFWTFDQRQSRLAAKLFPRVRYKRLT
jgi:predicted nucleic acid-binding protein